jgi:hypothetical protein
MKIFKGVLDWWFETGTEGVVWILQEDGKTGYSGLVVIKPGDYLKVFRADGSVIFEGGITLDITTGLQASPYNPEYKQQAALGYWIHWIQQGWSPDDWARLFMPEEGKPHLRAELTRN